MSVLHLFSHSPYSVSLFVISSSASVILFCPIVVFLDLHFLSFLFLYFPCLLYLSVSVSFTSVTLFHLLSYYLSCCNNSHAAFFFLCVEFWMPLCRILLSCFPFSFTSSIIPLISTSCFPIYCLPAFLCSRFPLCGSSPPFPTPDPFSPFPQSLPSPRPPPLVPLPWGPICSPSTRPGVF